MIVPFMCMLAGGVPDVCLGLCGTGSVGRVTGLAPVSQRIDRVVANFQAMLETHTSRGSTNSDTRPYGGPGV